MDRIKEGSWQESKRLKPGTKTRRSRLFMTEGLAMIFSVSLQRKAWPTLLIPADRKERYSIDTLGSKTHPSVPQNSD